jgi:hypothetical protein
MFLLNNDEIFSELRRELCARALHEQIIDFARTAKLIAPWDIAGLGDLRRRNWYPVLFKDLIDGRQKLGATEAEVQNLLARLAIKQP